MTLFLTVPMNSLFPKVLFSCRHLSVSRDWLCGREQRWRLRRLRWFCFFRWFPSLPKATKTRIRSNEDLLILIYFWFLLIRLYLRHNITTKNRFSLGVSLMCRNLWRCTSIDAIKVGLYSAVSVKTQYCGVTCGLFVFWCILIVYKWRALASGIRYNGVLSV